MAGTLRAGLAGRPGVAVGDGARSNSNSSGWMGGRDGVAASAHAVGKSSHRPADIPRRSEKRHGIPRTGAGPGVG